MFQEMKGFIEGGETIIENRREDTPVGTKGGRKPSGQGCEFCFPSLESCNKNKKKNNIAKNSPAFMALPALWAPFCHWLAFLE